MLDECPRNAGSNQSSGSPSASARSGAEPLAQAGGGGVIVLERGPQSGRMGRPSVAGNGGAPVERLLQISRRLVVQAGGQALAPQRPVGGKPGLRVSFGECSFLAVGKIEERATGLRRAFHHVLRHSVSDHGQESEVAAGCADLVGDPARLAGDVHHGDHHVSLP
jgi:hypothetical protein